MENIRYTGLAGKARRAHQLSRASRMYAQQLIDEYLYPEFDSRPLERFIPIRGRSEFFPSTASVGNEPAAPPQRQFELPLTTAGVTVERSTGVKVADGSRRDSVIRPFRTTFQPKQRRKDKQSPFTPGGFLFGCALGSAAAAMVLLVVQLAVG